MPLLLARVFKYRESILVSLVLRVFQQYLRCPSGKIIHGNIDVAINVGMHDSFKDAVGSENPREKNPPRQ